MTCPLCQQDESSDRCHWPHPDSPLSFFGPTTWLDDDELDREIHALRLGGGVMDAAAIADALGVRHETVRTYVYRGQLPAPTRTECCYGGNRSLWSADQVAGLLARAK